MSDLQAVEKLSDGLLADGSERDIHDDSRSHSVYVAIHGQRRPQMRTIAGWHRTRPVIFHLSLLMVPVMPASLL